MDSVGDAKQVMRAPSAGPAAEWSAWRRPAASFLVVAAAAGFVAFATLGAFDNRSDPFPHSISGVGSPAHPTTGGSHPSTSSTVAVDGVVAH